MGIAELKMSETERDLKMRTKGFALRVLKLVDAVPKTTAARLTEITSAT